MSDQPLSDADRTVSPVPLPLKSDDSGRAKRDRPTNDAVVAEQPTPKTARADGPVAVIASNALGSVVVDLGSVVIEDASSDDDSDIASNEDERGTSGDDSDPDDELTDDWDDDEEGDSDWDEEEDGDDDDDEEEGDDTCSIP
jgi:hypothetical protein